MQTCRLVVLDRTVNSMTEFKQIIGRGTRVREDCDSIFLPQHNSTRKATVCLHTFIPICAGRYAACMVIRIRQTTSLPLFRRRDVVVDCKYRAFSWILAKSTMQERIRKQGKLMEKRRPLPGKSSSRRNCLSYIQKCKGISLIVLNSISAVLLSTAGIRPDQKRSGRCCNSSDIRL